MTSLTDAHWDEWLLFVVQVLTLVFLVIYVIKTWQMASATKAAAEVSRLAVEESREARLESLAPQILIYLNPAEISIAEIIVENAGRGTARDVAFTFEPRLGPFGRHNPQQYFEAPKALLPPGSKIRHFLDTWPNVLKADNPRTYAVDVTYEGVENGRSYRVRHVLDVRDHENRVQISRFGFHDLVREIEKLRREFESFSRDARTDRQRSYARTRYAGADRDTLPEAIAAIRAKWPVFRDHALEGSHDVWWDPGLEDLRAEAVAALILAHRPDCDSTAREAIAEFTDAVLRYARVGDSTWTGNVESAFQRVALLTDQGAVSDV